MTRLALRRELPPRDLPVGRNGRGTAAAAPAPPPYNVLTAIPWSHAYWAEGPEFLALAVADGAVVANLPDEIGTADAVQGTAAQKPLYKAASGLNAQPGIRLDGVNDLLSTGTWANVSLPYTVVLIAKMIVQTDGTTYVLVGGLNTSTGRAEIMTNVTPNPDQWMAFAGANVSGGDADTAAHLFVAEYAAASGSLLTVDGTVLASGVTSTQINAGLVLGMFGNGSSFPTNEDVAFLGFINRVLTAQEKADLRTWSTAKYATA